LVEDERRTRPASRVDHARADAAASGAVPRRASCGGTPRAFRLCRVAFATDKNVRLPASQVALRAAGSPGIFPGREGRFGFLASPRAPGRLRDSAAIQENDRDEERAERETSVEEVQDREEREKNNVEHAGVSAPDAGRFTTRNRSLGTASAGLVSNPLITGV
jgi:hypothetical protein